MQPKQIHTGSDGPITSPLRQAVPGVASRGNLRRIPDLRSGELVVSLLHRHPLTLIPLLAPPVVLLVLWAGSALLVVPFLLSLQVDPILSANPPPAWVAPVLWFAWFGLAFLFLSRLVYVLLDWREDWIALTTRRVIVMNKSLFVREERRECPIGKVQNVAADFPNPIGMAFDFGDLHVDTAGVGTISFTDLPHPALIREAIFKQQEIMRSKQPPPEDLRKAAVRSIILGQEPRQHAQSGVSEPKSRRRLAQVSGHGPFGSFFPISPQRDGARVTWHKHWTYLFRGLAAPAIAYALVLAAWLGIPRLILHDPGGPIAFGLGWLAVGLFPVCGGWALWNLEDWRNDLYRLDHERVYHIESLPFGLREQSMETLISRISDVRYVVPGPLANLFNYGDVVIQTPGEATQFAFKGIACPRDVQQEIMERVDEYRRKSNEENDEDIEAWIKAYHDVMRGA